MISEKQIEFITKLPAEKRYEYSIKWIADYANIWTISDIGGLRTYSDNNGKIIFPVWPFSEFAALCCKDEYINCRPESIELELFLKEYLPDFIKENYQLGVFPLSNDKGVVIDIKMFEIDIANELKKY